MRGLSRHQNSSFCCLTGAVVIAALAFSFSLRAQSPSPAWPFPSRSPATAGWPTPAPRLYDTSAKFVRYLFNKYPNELFPKFVDRVIVGAPATETLVEIYENEFSDMAEFEKRFSRFAR